MLTLTDLFCGAGGSSTGAEQVPGVTVRMAANHWALAVETHNRNMPHADHDTADISQAEPRRYPRTDILWASPECTNHSRAKGQSPEQQQDLEPLPADAAVRSRATMMDVLRFAEIHRYRAILVENVVEVRDWILWPAWVMGLGNLGYDHQLVYLNSMHAQQLGAGAPQSRDRLYVVAWRRGNRAPDLTHWTSPPAWCPSCGQLVRPVKAWKRSGDPHGRYRQQYVFRCPVPSCGGGEVYPGVLPAAAAIDWSLTGGRIGDRLRPLAAKTLARIEAGLRRYVQPGRPAMLVPSGGSWNTTAQPVTVPMRTRTSRESEALVVPLSGRDGLRARPVSEPGRTQTARLEDALVVPLRNHGVARLADTAPVPTVAAAGNHHGLVRWDHLVYGYDTGALRPVSRALPTQTTVSGDAVLGPNLHVDDCTFRMLEPHEIQAAMAFPVAYDVLGNKRERVRQLGNAVTPPAARDLVAAVVESLTGERVSLRT